MAAACTKYQEKLQPDSMKVLDHVMPREKRCRALGSCFGLVGPHQQSIPNFSLWHHEFIKATRSAALVVLN